MTVPFRDPARLFFLDRLTQLYNWWFMAQYLKERFAWLAEQKIPLSVIMLNLDDFRTINDTHGRLAGDVVLRRVAELLLEGRRKGGYAIRYAGDEFFVFLEGMETARALAVAEEIRQRISAQPIVLPHMPSGIPVQASLGVAAFPEEAQTASGLIEKVRRAVARSKHLGKNRVSQDTGERLPTEKEALERLHRPRLLGRDQDLARYKTLFEQARAGGNLFILIQGEHGVGKSRFLAELPGLSRSAGLEFVQGGCLAQSQAVPYSALTPWLQEYFDRSPEKVAPITVRLAGPKLAALGSLLPFLTPSKGEGEAIPAPERRRLLFEGVVDLLCLISQTAPLVVLLENLHWADESSLAVLLHLLSREDGKLLVCATAVTDGRAEPESDLRSLPRFLPQFEASAQCHRVTFAPLTFLQVAELAMSLLRHSIPARFHQLLYQVSRGIPLLVEETLKGLITRGVLKEEEDAWNFDQVTLEHFPATPDEAIARRLEILEPETLELVSEASVIGPELDLPVLAEVLGQDPAETLQIVDRGRRHGVFDKIDPVADPGEIRFTHERLQEVVYDGLDAAHRRQTHRKVAEVYERLKAPESHEALGPLAYHFERSDDPGKAAIYREKLRELREWLFSWMDVGAVEKGEAGGGEAGTVKVRIQEATRLIDERTVPLAVQFVRTLAVAAKNMRVFPKESQLVREEVAAATTSLLTLVESAEAVTLAEHRQALLVNGRTLEAKALGGATQDLLRFFAEHGIRSVTFVRGVSESEVGETLKILSGPPLGIRPEVARWEELLSSRGLVHVGVLPALYLDVRKKEAGRPVGKEALLDDEALRLAADMFRSLMAAVDNVRLYPPESELNLLMQEKLDRQAQALLDRVPAVTIALADETIVINGAKANPKVFGITIPLLRKLLHDNGLTSLTLTQGVSRADLGVFVSQMARPREADAVTPLLWGKLLEDHGIRTIQVGTKSYTAARAWVVEGGSPGAAVPGGAAAPGGALTEEDRLLRDVAQWLEETGATPGFRQEQIPSALDAWLGSDREDLARQLWERIMAGLASLMAGTRQRAAAALHLLLTGGTPRILSWLLSLSFEPLEKALLKEMSPHPFQWEARAAAEALKLFLKEGDLARSARLAEALVRGQKAKPNEKEFLSLAATAVQTLVATGALRPILAALRESDPTRREQAKAVLSALGEGALNTLAELIVVEDDEEMRKVAATLLRSLPNAGLQLLVPQLRPPASGETSRRIVSVLDLLTPQLGPDFFFLLAHPDVLVRAEFAGVLSRLPRGAAVRFLERALGETQPERLVGALECIRGIQATELLDAVVRLLRRVAQPDVLKASCLCLGYLKDERGVRPLVEVLQRRPRFLGLVKGLPETVRAVAARALGDLPFPEADQGLRAALRDSSLTVRSSARVALARLQQGREPR